MSPPAVAAKMPPAPIIPAVWVSAIERQVANSSHCSASLGDRGGAGRDANDAAGARTAADGERVIRGDHTAALADARDRGDLQQAARADRPAADRDAGAARLGAGQGDAGGVHQAGILQIGARRVQADGHIRRQHGPSGDHEISARAEGERRAAR